MTRSDLLALVYRFYPRGLLVGGPDYDDTEERYRQREAARRGAAEYPTWDAMTDRLGARYPLMSHSVCLLAGWCVPAYSADIEIPGYVIGFHVSLLGPCYGIRRTGAPGEEPVAHDLAREIEATYPGYEPIPPELGNEVVPDVSLDKRLFGEATIYDCLLSQEWEASSGPWPPSRCVPPAGVTSSGDAGKKSAGVVREGGAPHEPQLPQVTSADRAPVLCSGGAARLWREGCELGLDLREPPP
jgi:hypothetical protein